jgi:hypothetical protein
VIIDWMVWVTAFLYLILALLYLGGWARAQHLILSAWVWLTVGLGSLGFFTLQSSVLRFVLLMLEPSSALLFGLAGVFIHLLLVVFEIPLLMKWITRQIRKPDASKVALEGAK